MSGGGAPKVPTISEIGSGISDAATGLKRNIEKSAQNVAQGASALASGKWDNAGRSLLDVAGSGSLLKLAVNPDDITNATGMQTLKDRKTEDAVAQANTQAAADIAATAQAALDAKNQIIDNAGVARRRAPGRAAVTLTGGTSGGGSLLTPKG